MILETIGIWLYKTLAFIYSAVKTVVCAFGECIIDILEVIVEIFNN